MKYTKITLSGSFKDTGRQSKSLSAASSGPVFRFDEFLIRTEKIIRNGRIDRVLIEMKSDFQPFLFSGAEEVRKRLEQVKASGKELYFFIKSYTSLALYLASVSTYRIIHPLGTLSFLGFSRSFLFFRRAMDSYGIEAEIVRRGKYKSAGDRFRTDRLDPANEEQYGAYYQGMMDEAYEKVRDGFEKSEDALNELLDGRILDAENASEEKWVDEVSTLEKIEKRWKKEEKIKHVRIKSKGRSFSKGLKKIAVLVFEGAVVDGKTSHIPLIGQAIGSETFAEYIEKLRKKKSVKGVVLRINSGGGSATASEDVLDSLDRLAEEKPLFVSMSEVAGSGGYWIACGAEKLFVNRTTLTGSIGVIMMSIGLRDFLEGRGITESTIRTAAHADMGSPFRPMREKERGMLDSMVESHYRLFLDKVAGFRNSTTEEIEALAGGRVWSGKDAVEKGLADEIGGLEEAISSLKERLGLSKTKVVFFPEIKRSFLEKKLMKREAGNAMYTNSTYPAAALNAFEWIEYVNSRPFAVMPNFLPLSTNIRSNYISGSL